MKQFGIGQPLRRVEDRRFITGRGTYLDDINRSRQAYAAMLRSPHAHARIRGVDTTAAASAAGAPSGRGSQAVDREGSSDRGGLGCPRRAFDAWRSRIAVALDVQERP